MFGPAQQSESALHAVPSWLHAEHVPFDPHTSAVQQSAREAHACPRAVQHLPPLQVMSLPQHGASGAHASPFFPQVVQWSGLIDGLVVSPAVHVSALVVPCTQSHSD
jgi:hypothetical protein